MSSPRIFADFQNTDAQGRVRLNTVGTLEDLSRLQVHLREGLALTLYQDDADEQGRPQELQAEGVATYSQGERCWVATIDWDALRRVPFKDVASSHGAPPAPPATVSPGQTSHHR